MSLWCISCLPKPTYPNHHPQNARGLNSDKRIVEMSIESKRALLREHRKATSSPPHKSPNRSGYSASVGPAAAAHMLPRLVPQLTGDAGLLKRISMHWTGPLPTSLAEDGDSGAFAPEPTIVEDIQPLVAQPTGGGWSRWWASSGGEDTNSAKSYVNRLRTGKITENKLTKDLIGFRAHFSGATDVWRTEFLEEHGLEALSTLLASLVTWLTGFGKDDKLPEIGLGNLLAVMRCLHAVFDSNASRSILIYTLLNYSSRLLCTPPSLPPPSSII